MALLLGHIPHPDCEFHRRPEVIEFVLTLKVMGFDHFPTRLQLTVQDFLLSFSNPNVYFHSATAYDILRMAGVEVGKRDYLGALRLKPAG